MRKIVFRAHGDCVGTDFYKLEEVPVNTTDGELNNMAEETGREWVDSFHPQADPEDFDNDEDYWEDYYAQCGWWWEDYNSEKHDGYL